MTNEDKLKQIARNIAYNLGNKVCDDIKTYGYEDVYNAALQALQWKDNCLNNWLDILNKEIDKLTTGNLAHSTPKKIERYAVESFELKQQNTKSL